MYKIEKPFIIPIFIPQQGCPHQCVFCNQRAITGVNQTIPSPEELRLQINTFLQYKVKKRKSSQIAFYGGNFMGLKPEIIKMMLNEASQLVKRREVDSIRFSTRPDTINNEQLDIIKDFPVSTIEIGVQSMDDEVLSISNRGHKSSDTKDAVCFLKKRGYQIGMQMMVGLPGDNEIKSLDTGEKIAELSPDFVRIYPTLVLEKSILAKWYKSGKYIPMSLEQSVTLVKKLYRIFKERDIPVIRMGLQTTEDFEKEAVILAGPYHPAFGHLVYSEIFLDMISESFRNSGIQEFFDSQSFNPTQSSPSSVLIKVHPRSISKIKGLKNKNIDILRNKFHIQSVKIVPDIFISEEGLKIEFQA